MTGRRIELEGLKLSLITKNSSLFLIEFVFSSKSLVYHNNKVQNDLSSKGHKRLMAWKVFGSSKLHVWFIRTSILVRLNLT